MMHYIAMDDRGGTMQIEGTVAAGFEGVRAAFAAAQADDPGGAQLSAYRRGEQVVDLWTRRDTPGGRPFTGETLSVLMSCTKGMAATVAHRLAERGAIDLDAPVARYWPAFAAGGKAEITVSDLLSHRAGLAAFDPESQIGVSQMLDWNASTTALAQMAPLWPPATAFAYHAVTFGYLVGEVVREVTGKSIGTVFAEEIAAPLGLDLWIGLPEAEEARVAPQFGGGAAMTAEQHQAMLTTLGLDPSLRIVKAMLGAPGDPEANNRFMNSRAAHAAEIPAGNGIGNARSLARMYAATIGEVDGVRLLGSDAVNRARRPQTDGLGGPAPLDRLPNDYPLRFGLGYELHRAGSPMLGPGSFGHTGAGGRLGFADPESGLAVGYVCSNMAWEYLRGPDARWTPWLGALRRTLAA
jgi:CubicO group peptidase (beta-lactamase class C family)